MAGPTVAERRDRLFERALDMPARLRPEFVEQIGADDPALADDLRSLLEAHDAADEYFDRLAAEVVAPVLSAIVRTASAGDESELWNRLQGDLADVYRLERELGGAGMSRVFVAEDLGLRRRIVIKVLPPDGTTTTSKERLQREIELTARLQHPHIVPVLAAGSAGGMLYYTMPFVAGESLRDRIAREGPLPVDEARRIWSDVLDALAHAHTHGVVHRDVKPGNILLSGRNALVTDFGISSVIEPPTGRPPDPAFGPANWTPAYAAPETTAADGGADHRADLYGAGLVMYEMLTGSPPFDADSAEAYVRAHRDVVPPPIVRPDAPEALVSLVMRCLSKNPDDRPESADAALAELADQPASGDFPLTTDSAPGRTRRAAVFGAAALALAVIAITTTLQRNRAEMPSPGAAPDAGTASDTGRYRPDIAAHELYARGMDVALLRTAAGRLEGVEYFRRAIALDSSYVDAYAGLANMYLQHSSSVPGKEKSKWFELAEEAALKAVDLDEASANARASLGWLRLLGREYPAAEAEFRRAITIDPTVPRVHEGLARVFMMTGRPVEQLDEARIGLDADPFSHSAIREFGLALAANDRCRESLGLLESAKKLSPPAGVVGIVGGLCYAALGMWPESIEEFEWARDQSATAAPAFLAFSLARAGRADQARAILGDLLEGRTFSHGSFGIGIVYAGLGDYDQAFAWLDRAADDRTLHFYIVHPAFRDLHADPRWDPLRRRLGIGGP